MNKKLLALFIILLTLPSIWPLFRSDFFRMHDYTHAARLQQLDKAVKDGHFPIRWSKDLGFGYGMPLFNFYAPLPYYLAEVFHLLGFSFLNSIKICFGLTFFISFLGMFLLAKKFWGTLGGILAGIAFVYSPYRAVDFYVRGALGELFAIGFIPLAIWALVELIEKKSKKFLALTAIILASLFLSHTVLTLICFPALIIIALFYLYFTGDKLRGFIYSLISFVFGFGLSAFFLIPAFLEKTYTQVDKLTQGFSHYGHHFLYFRQFFYGNWGYGGSVDGIEDLMSFHLGKGHLLLVVITLLFSLFQIIIKKKIEKKHWLIAFFAAFLLVLAYLSTYHAKSIWDAVPIMAFIQFPWRFNSLIIVFVGLLSGGGCFYFEKKFGKKRTFVFFIIFILTILKLNIRYFRPEKYINPNDYYYTDEQSIRNSMSSIIPDYIPIWVKEFPKEIPDREYKVMEGNLDIDVIEAKTHKLVLKAEAESPSKLQLNRFYFPGWQLKVDGIKKKINYKDNNGIIYFSLPKGKNLVSLEFKNTLIRNLANLITVISFFTAGLIFLKNERRR